MAKEVYMPALGMNQETGTLLRWHKAEGETVTKGEPLMEIATDKTDVEIEAPASGVLRRVTAHEGDEVPVGQVIAWIAAADEVLPGAEPAVNAPAPVAPEPPAAPPGAAPAPAPISPLAARVAARHGVDVSRIKPVGGRIQKDDVLAYIAAQETQLPAGRVLASPKARRLAQEAGIALADLTGSGPEGAVLAADVVAAHAAPAPAVPAPQPVVEQVPAAPQTLPMPRMWKVMAERLTESWTTVPHFFLGREVDAAGLVAWREAAQARSDAKLTITDCLVKLVAYTLRWHPRVNASWRSGSIVANEEVNVGIAVAVEDGLLVPVIRRADQLGLNALAAARTELVGRSQNGKLTPDDLAGGTFTISNLGMLGIDHFSAIINPPQAAILAVGRIVDKVVAVTGQPAVRPRMGLNLSCDHRVVDGARAARFLDDLAAAIEDPLRLLD
jgi:pyruvate dehydrogenase E2 component (dihydrolipoamide acetyltransferase)